ncbi:MAG: CpsD/CapB family tyrosine-protein kinase [Eubacteriales bacterium]
MNLFSSKSKNLSSGKKTKMRLSADSPFSIKETYNSIRTKLMFTGKGESCPTFVVTSSLAGDGKTTTAVSLAVSIAAAEQRVLLIDADMRKPSIHRYFNMEYSDGLSEFLAGLTDQPNLRHAETDGVTVLTAGQVPPNPAELLGSKQFNVLLEKMRECFDYIIIDTPPVNIVTDATVFASSITGYVFVVQSGKNQRRDLQDGIRQIEEMNGNIVGLVLNDPENKAERHYSYRYNKYYRYGKYKYYGEGSSSQRK